MVLIRLRVYHYGDVLQTVATTTGHIASRSMATSFNLVLKSDGEQPPYSLSRFSTLVKPCDLAGEPRDTGSEGASWHHACIVYGYI